MSPGASSACTAILFDVEVPLVTKKTWSAPKARAAISCAFLMLPVGSSRLSRPPVVALLSARNRVEPVELAHVADPVGLEDRLAARDRQRVERADRPLRVFLQIVEERRLVARLHALEDREMQLEQLLDRIEHAAHRLRLRASGDLLDLAVRHQVEVELGPHALEHLREVQRPSVRALALGPRPRSASAGSARHAASGTGSLRG